MLRLVVLISGGGSNLRALLEASHDAEFPARVVAIGADRDADGLAHAEEFGIASSSSRSGRTRSREEWGDALLEQIAQWEADVVILSGFMRLLPPAVVDALAPRLLNTHPAYLPEFPGAHAVRDALDRRARPRRARASSWSTTASTAGRSWRSAACRCSAATPRRRLHDRIKLVERELLVQVVLDLADGRLDLEELA